MDQVANEEIFEVKAEENTKQKSIKKDFWLKVWEYSLPALSVLIITLIILAIKGIYPFGHGATGYIDYNVGLIPSYTYYWDVLHGKANPFVDWNLGGATNSYINTMYSLFLMPIDLLIGIFPRESIAYTMIFIILIKFCLMSVGSYWFFRKTFTNVNKYVCLIFAVLWAFSGWTMVHYTNVGWLDIMILLPFLLNGLLNIFKGKSMWQFVLFLTWMLMIGYYLVYMFLVALTLCAFVYILICVEKDKRKSIASKLFFATIISILISVVFFIPNCLFSLGAHRFTSESTNTGVGKFDMFFSKTVVLLFYSLPIYLIARLFTKYREDKKNILFIIISLAILLAGLLIEPINAMWHTGSYWCFPYRYSYTIIFFISCCGLYYLNKFTPKNSFLKVNKKDWTIEPIIKYILLTIVLLTAVIVTFLFGCSNGEHPYKAISFTTFIMYFAIMLLGTFIIHFGVSQNNKTIKILCIILVCTSQVFVYNAKYLGSYFQYENYAIDNVLNIKTENLEQPYRLKDRDNLYFENYPRITGYPSISTWFHVSSENQWQTHHKLGFYEHGTVLSDAGGTLFADMLVGNRYFMSELTLNNQLFTYIDTWKYDYYIVDEETNLINTYSKNVYLYEYNYYLPYVYSFNSDQILNDFENDLNPFDLQNKIYKDMFNKSSNIIDYVTPISISNVDENGFYEIVLPCDSLQELYFYGKSEEIIIGDYTKETHSGIFDIGTYDSNITIKIKTGDVNNIKFAKIDISILQALKTEVSNNLQTYTINGRNIIIEYNNTQNDKYLYLPITYLEHFDIRVNNKIVETKKALNGYLGIKLDAGLNNIEIKFVPKYAKMCLIVSIISLLVFITFIFLNKRFKISENKVIQWIGTGGAILIFSVVAFLVYLKPTFNFIISFFA